MRFLFQANILVVQISSYLIRVFIVVVVFMCTTYGQAYGVARSGTKAESNFVAIVIRPVSLWLAESPSKPFSKMSTTTDSPQEEGTFSAHQILRNNTFIVCMYIMYRFENKHGVNASCESNNTESG